MKTLTPKEIAVEFQTDPKTLRKFLRSITPKDDQPGKGSRWSVPANAKSLTKLRSQFDAWEIKRKEDAARRAEEAAAQAATDDEVEDDATEVTDDEVNEDTVDA
jgi:hypothetical protein